MPPARPRPRRPDPGPATGRGPGRGIIVLNGNFAPASPAGPFKYGAVAYALKAAEALHRRGLLAGFLLYRRDEGLDRPRLEPAQFPGYPALELGFHFGMGREVVGASLEAARVRLDRGRLYYQTNVLLPFHPPGRPFVVTHHAPFVDHVVEVMGPRLAEQAFGAGHAKLEHLRSHQRLGLDRLARSHGSAIEISAIQADYLRRHGVEGRFIHRIHPPLEWSDGANGLSGEGARLRRFIGGAGPGLVLCTACSRLDAFKNVELLVEAALRLLRSGLDLRVLIIGGPPGDGERRRLERRVDESLAHRFRFAPRVSRDDLARLLNALAGRGLFVCPSRYETCGLTPLEAAARGVCTLVADTPDRVEAASLVPPRQRFAPTVEGLAAAVRRLTAGPLPAGDRVLDEPARAGSLAFDALFIDTWRRLTAPHAAGRRGRPDSGRPVPSPEPVHPA